MDVPITPEGRREIAIWAAWFKDRGGLDMVFHSSLGRDGETAKLLAKPSRATLVDLGADLFPQNMGTLSGQPREYADPSMRAMIANPGMRPPKGESLNTFKATYLPVLGSLLRMGRSQKIAVVSHGSNIQLANAWISAGAKQTLEINPGALGLKVSPGDVFYVDPFNFLSVPQIKLSQADRAPLANGLFQVRHGRTAWSA